MSNQPLLSIRGVTTIFSAPSGRVVAVDGVSFDISRGEVFGLVGESGCGKTATCRSIIRLFAGATASIVGGSILFDGKDLLTLSEAQMSDIRGAKIAMIFQDPMTSLNPTMRVGEQIAEGLRRHRGLTHRQALGAATDLLGRVGVPWPRSRIADYPHQFSGGMRQRVMIAIALACRPLLLIADEPTTALDVTIQDQILKLLLSLRDEHGMSILLVTHDLGVVAQTCDQVAVMYAGRIAELADTRSLFRHSRHPYTRALFNSIPGQSDGTAELVPIAGAPPDLVAPPSGCRFHPRCSYAIEACATALPDLLPVGPKQATACIRHEILT
jgi:peptide/nickel transport system ATP-binding protein/oligopeptide transport system ATP-binding protein